MKQIITFGEIMLRLSPPDHEVLLQSPVLEATFGGEMCIRDRDRRGLCRTRHKVAEEGLLFKGSCLCRPHDHGRRQKDNRDKEEHQRT